MDTIKVKDREFRVSIPENIIMSEVKRVASEINRDYKGKNPLFLAILNGSFMYAADLLREIDIPCQISFVKMASYSGTETTGTVNQVIGLNESIKGRDVIIIEDIVDTGYTMQRTLQTLKEMEPASLSISAMLCKLPNLKVDLGDSLKYVAMDIPSDFIVGYGLDYDGYGRNLRDIYTIV